MTLHQLPQGGSQRQIFQQPNDMHQTAPQTRNNLVTDKSINEVGQQSTHRDLHKLADTDPRRLDLKRQSTEEQSSVSGLMKPTYMRNLHGSLDRRVSALSKTSQYAFSNRGRLQTRITDQSFNKNDSKSIFRRKQSLLNQNRRVLSPKKIAIGLKTTDQNKKRIDSGKVSTKNLASMTHAHLSSPFRPHMLAINHAPERPHVHPVHSKSQQFRFSGVAGVRYQP